MYSNVSFKCIHCNTPLAGSIVIPQMTMDDDTETHDTQAIECDVCCRTYHVDITNSGGLINVSITGLQTRDITVSSPDVALELVQPAPNWISDYGWYVNLKQKTVFQYFTVSVTNIRDMFTLRIDDRHQAEILNRMLLVQCISCLEAYLSDTLIARVTSQHRLLARLYETDPVLKNEKLPVCEFIVDSNLPLKKARLYLEGLVYHNIPKIEALYRQVLDVTFDYGGNDQKDILFSAIRARHDFVHRNGKVKETGDIRTIDKKYISSILLVIERLVWHIEEHLKQNDLHDIPF